jgi:hypothetical protein
MKMSNWYGSARTNEVTVINMKGLKKALKPFDVIIEKRKDNKVVFLPPKESDGDFYYSIFDDKTDDDIEFNWESFVMPYIKENDILIVMCCGAEKLRYITGDTQAYIRRGDNVESIGINLSDIYDMAKDKFNVDDVSRCEY